MAENSETKQAQNRAVEKLRERFADMQIDVYEFRGDTTVTIPLGKLMEVITFLKTDPELQFNHFTDLAGVHYPEREKPFEVIYNLTSIPNLQRIRVKVNVGAGEKPPSMTALWSAANWHERELYDMFGIQVEGHPDLTRMFLPDDFEDFPLKKDFPLRGRN